jgi:hypothetical protein
MPDENPIRELPPEMIERDVLYMLTGDAPIWSVDDLGRVLEDRVAAIDAVGGLRRSGLLRQTTDGYVVATHAGVRAVEMIGRVA